jgi:GT2 family glycosyltransferase
LLDEENFGFFGWGGDIDYCIRVRKVGFEVMVTDRAFLNHLGRATADHVFVDYKPKALQDFRLGMKRKYGRFWGRFQEVGMLRRTLKALRSSITSTQWFAALTMRTSRAN